MDEIDSMCVDLLLDKGTTLVCTCAIKLEIKHKK